MRAAVFVFLAVLAVAAADNSGLIAAMQAEAVALAQGAVAGFMPNTLPHDGVTTIGPGQYLQSPSGLYVLQFLGNGDLGLFAGHAQIWQAPRTENRGTPGHVSFDVNTGIMGMYSSTNQLWWASNQVISNCHPTARRHCPPAVSTRPVGGVAPYALYVQDSGNVEIVDKNGKVVFESATSTAGMLVADITASGRNAVGATNINQLESFLQGWQLPSDVHGLFQQAAFASRATFQTFTYHARAGDAGLDEWVGAAETDANDNVRLAFVHISVSGKPVQQYNHVSSTNCHSCWLIGRCCSTATSNVPRGYSADELMSILVSMRKAGYLAIGQQLASLPK